MNQMLTPTDNLFDYFHERVQSARDRRRAPISEDAALYLATLLTDRARADRPAPSEATLAELHGRAAHAAPAEQARTYRELGDSALYAVGYFEESLDRQVVGPGYYIDMGSAAYFRVDQVFKRWFADAFGPVFHELSTRFRDCVGVVTDVRDAHLANDPHDLFLLYRRWARTGSGDVAARLRQAGLIVPDDPTDEF